MVWRFRARCLWQPHRKLPSCGVANADADDATDADSDANDIPNSDADRFPYHISHTTLHCYVYTPDHGHAAVLPDGIPHPSRDSNIHSFARHTVANSDAVTLDISKPHPDADRLLDRYGVANSAGASGNI